MGRYSQSPEKLKLSTKSLQLLFKNKGDVKTITDKQKIRELVDSRPNV